MEGDDSRKKSGFLLFREELSFCDICGFKVQAGGLSNNTNTGIKSSGREQIEHTVLLGRGFHEDTHIELIVHASEGNHHNNNNNTVALLPTKAEIQRVTT